MPVFLRVQTWNGKNVSIAWRPLNSGMPFNCHLCHRQLRTSSMRFFRRHLSSRCQCRCHGIASNVFDVSVELHRHLLFDQINPNCRILNMWGMTLNPAKRKMYIKVKDKRTVQWNRSSNRIRKRRKSCKIFLSVSSYQLQFAFQFFLHQDLNHAWPERLNRHNPNSPD